MTTSNESRVGTSDADSDVETSDENSDFKTSSNDSDVQVASDLPRPIRYPQVRPHLKALSLAAPDSRYEIYEASLYRHGIRYVNNVRGIPNSFFTETIGMTEGSVNYMLDHFKRVALEAEKKQQSKSLKRKLAALESDLD